MKLKFLIPGDAPVRTADLRGCGAAGTRCLKSDFLGAKGSRLKKHLGYFVLFFFFPFTSCLGLWLFINSSSNEQRDKHAWLETPRACCGP